MAQRVYLESTIPSYLAGRPSRDLLQAALQAVTREWWDAQRSKFKLCISQIVLEEVQSGDPDAVRRRMAFLENLEILAATPEVNLVAKAIIGSGLLPQKAARDAIHIAITSVHAIDFLLTWNCRHIANAAIFRGLTDVVGNLGYALPVLCTPQELLGV